MGDKTGISWTDSTWNPVRGCSRVSAGCENCYAEKVAARFHKPGLAYEGLTRETSRGRVWNGEVKLVAKHLDDPLRWQRPRRIFVNSMSDLFHENIPNEFIAAVFGVMAASDRHTFQVLTKRPERMREWFRWVEAGPVSLSDFVALGDRIPVHRIANCAGDFLGSEDNGNPLRIRTHSRFSWPLPNVWLGVSAEDQATADERIPLLLQTPAAVRFVSAEPLLGPLDLDAWLKPTKTIHMRADVRGMLRNRAFDGLQDDDGRPMSRHEAKLELESLLDRGVDYMPVGPACDGFDPIDGCPGHPNPALNWVIVGGESGPGARPCSVGWVRNIVAQCSDAGVACFVKQLGSNSFLEECDIFAPPFSDDHPPIAWDLPGKGDDPSEWPEDLRVQEFQG